MIIFADKKTGQITGKIDGRIHGQEHSKIWIGDKKNTIRLVIQYKLGEKTEEIVERKIKIGEKLDKDGFYQPIYKTIKQKEDTPKFEPDLIDKEQRQIIIDIENGANIYDYKIDLKTKKLLKVV